MRVTGITVFHVSTVCLCAGEAVLASGTRANTGHAPGTAGSAPELTDPWEATQGMAIPHHSLLLSPQRMRSTPRTQLLAASGSTFSRLGLEGHGEAGVTPLESPAKAGPAAVRPGARLTSASFTAVSSLCSTAPGTRNQAVDECSLGKATVSFQTTFWNHYMQGRGEEARGRRGEGKGKEGKGGEGRDISEIFPQGCKLDGLFPDPLDLERQISSSLIHR